MSAANDPAMSLDEARRRRAEIAADLARRVKERDEIREEMRILERIDKRRREETGSKRKESDDWHGTRKGLLRRLWDWLRGVAWSEGEQPAYGGTANAPSQPSRPPVEQLQDGQGAAIQMGGSQPPGVQTNVPQGTGSDAAGLDLSISSLVQRMEVLENQIADLQKQLDELDKLVESLGGEKLGASLDTRRGRFQQQEPVVIRGPKGEMYAGRVVGMSEDRRPIVSLEGMDEPMSVEDGWEIGMIESLEGLDGSKSAGEETGGEDEGSKPTV